MAGQSKYQKQTPAVNVVGKDEATKVVEEEEVEVEDTETVEEEVEEEVEVI